MSELYENEEFIYNRIPVRIFVHYLDGVDIFTPMHWHRSVEFGLVTKDNICRIVDGNKFEQKKGDLLLINSEIPHGDHWIKETDHFEGVTVQISKSFLNLWIGENVRFKNPNTKEENKKIVSIISEFGNLKLQKDQISSEMLSDGFAEKPSGNLQQDMLRIRMMELLFRFMGILRTACVDDRKESERNKNVLNNIKGIVNYVDRHYTDNITLASVANDFHYTSAHLSRLFKKHMGTNFHDYLQYIRLMNCVEVIKNNQGIQLTQLALDNGFPNMKSFIETFKKYYGCTPSQWMKKRQ